MGWNRGANQGDHNRDTYTFQNRTHRNIALHKSARTPPMGEADCHSNSDGNTERGADDGKVQGLNED